MKTKYLTIKDVAESLQVVRQTVESWIADGDLPAVNISKGVRPRYRIGEDDLADFIKGRTREPAAN